jgi:hypothetical protein
VPKRWIAGGLAALALWPASALASAPSAVYSRVLQAYTATGSVPTCRFTSQQLVAVEGSVDTYGQQYGADFTVAIQTVLAGQATGICSHHHHRARFSASPGSAAAGPRPPASVTAATTSGIPAPLIALGIVAALGALGALLAALALRPGASSEWRHSWEEARYRMGLRGARRRGR